MRKYIVTAAAPITQRGADSTHCEVPGRDACSGDGRSAQPSCFVSETLTAREHDVLGMIRQGFTNKRIARAWEISPETVKSHVKHIFLKLAVSTRAQAVSRAGLFVPEPAVTVSRPNFLHVAAILGSAIVAIGCPEPVSADPLSFGARSPAPVNLPSPERMLLAQASGDTMARCQQLFGLYDRYNSDTLTRPLDARFALEDCRKGNIASGVAALKRSLERAQIPNPPAESGVAQTPAPVRPHGEGQRTSQ
jgi:DNA-binding CsgD family transcriptional regulator